MTKKTTAEDRATTAPSSHAMPQSGGAYELTAEGLTPVKTPVETPVKPDVKER